jgi:hypothetical protein
LEYPDLRNNHDEWPTKQIEAADEAAEDAQLRGEKPPEKLVAEKAASEKPAIKQIAKQNAGKEAGEVSANATTDDAQRITALTPPSDTSRPPLSAPNVAKLMQLELRRVGCLTSAADGDWNSTSRRSLALFNKYAGTKFDVKLASIDVLDAIKGKPSRVCPLVCDHGFRTDGDHCIKITCGAGYRLNDDNKCEKVGGKKPLASREEKREETRKSIQPGHILPNADRPSSAPSGNNRELSKHEATVRAEALYAKCKQQFGVDSLGQAKTTNAGMASCIRNGGRAN